MSSIAKEFNITPTNISKLLRNNNIEIDLGRSEPKYTCANTHFFKTIDTEEKAYWLGFMYADGFITRQHKGSDRLILGLSLHERDTDHVYKLKEAIGFNGNINHYVGRSSYGEIKYARLLAHDMNLTHDLISKGCVLNKTFVVTFPSTDIVPENLIIHFIRGYFDGDGTLTHFYSMGKYLKLTVSFTGTEEMLDGIKNFFNKPDLKLVQRYPERKNNNYTLNFSGNVQCMDILNQMYENSSIYLDRKHEKYLGYKELTGK